MEYNKNFETDNNDKNVEFVNVNLLYNKLSL